MQQLDGIGVACPPLDPSGSSALPVDVTQPVAALLVQGWPSRAIEVGTAVWFGPMAALTVGLPLDWPRHLLPLARRGGEALGWDGRTGQVVVVQAAASGSAQVLGPLDHVLQSLCGWFDAGAHATVTQVGSYAVLPDHDWQALVERVGRTALYGWIFQGVCDVASAARSLSGQRRQAIGTARWTSLVVGFAPVAGWLVGGWMTPPRPILGGAVGLFVVGGAPCLLMAFAMRRAAQLAQQLERLSRLRTPAAAGHLERLK